MSGLAEQITAAHNVEEARPTRVTKAAQVPMSYQSITAEWMTDILSASHPGVRVDAIRLDVDDSGSTNRRRIFIDYGPAASAGAPASVFCKATFDLRTKIVLAHMGSTHNEITFYNKLRPILDIEAPRAFYAKYDPVAFNSIVVLHDMASEVTFCDHKTPISRSQVEDQLGSLARIHGRFSQPAEFARLADLLSWGRRFAGFEAANGKIGCENGFIAAESIMPTRLFRRAAEVWPATCKAVAAHAQLPNTINHGDVHLKNWYIRNGNQAMGLADWQGTCRGHWARDVSYVLATALTIENRRAWERELLAFYLDHLHRAGGPKIPVEESFTYYRQQMFHALAWWTVTLRPAPGMTAMQPQETSLEFLSRITHAVDDLDSLDSFG